MGKPGMTQTKNIIAGAQIRAARALLGWRRKDLAEKAHLHCSSVIYWEARDDIPLSEPYACRLMRQALRSAGVDVTEIPTPPRKSEHEREHLHAA